jgi:large subunit ribosomal protein L29
MAILKKSDAKKMSAKDLEKKLDDLRTELARERASIHVGANATSPGRIREIRRTIARIKTMQKRDGGKEVRETG